MSSDSRSGDKPPDPWFDHARYGCMDALPRPAWGWELLRRDPRYRTAFRDMLVRRPQGEQGAQSLGHDDCASWSLCVFANPDIDVRFANVLWRPEARRDVLPLIAGTRHGKAIAKRLSLKSLCCRVTIHCEDASDRCQILFAQEGRSLQLDIHGKIHFENDVLLTPISPAPRLRGAQVLTMRRLVDLMAHGYLRPSLYPAYKRRARLIEVVQALDGEFADALQRDIALAQFGQDKVERVWHGSQNALRDHVRKTLKYGRQLMNGGYRRFLG